MIYWKKEYKKLHKKLIGITVLTLIAVIFFIIGFVRMTRGLDEKNDKIWQQEVEIQDLKEQIHVLEKEKNYERVR